MIQQKQNRKPFNNNGNRSNNHRAAPRLFQRVSTIAPKRGQWLSLRLGLYKKASQSNYQAIEPFVSLIKEVYGHQFDNQLFSADVLVSFEDNKHVSGDTLYLQDYQVAFELPKRTNPELHAFCLELNQQYHQQFGQNSNYKNFAAHLLGEQTKNDKQ